MNKKIKSNPTKKSIKDSTEKQETIETILLEEYGISLKEAEKLVINFENEQIQETNIESNEQKKKIETSKTQLPEQTQETNIESNEQKKKIETSKTQLPEQTQEKTNIDSIITDFIPDYHEEFSIELNNVNLTFEIVTDKIDTVKESIIRTLKRTKPKPVEFKALKDISFKIYKGEKVGIIGYNGAGKSTLLKVITGIYPPNSGNVITHGNISPLLSLGAGFDFNYSGRKNIYLNGAVLGYEKKFLQGKEAEIIEFSELGDFIDIPIKNYSSGMLAKLGFSIATIVDPDILIIDEILGVGDVNFQKKSADKIRSLMDGGTTVLLVSHSIAQIRNLCDKAIWIDEGHVREIGDVNVVCDNYLKDSEKATSEQLKNIKLR